MQPFWLKKHIMKEEFSYCEGEYGDDVGYMKKMINEINIFKMDNKRIIDFFNKNIDHIKDRLEQRIDAMLKYDNYKCIYDESIYYDIIKINHYETYHD